MKPLLEVRDLEKTFEIRRKSGTPWRGRELVKAVSGVSFTLARGEVLGLVGESGSGKTTVARCIVGLEGPSAGAISVDGVEISGLTGRQFRPLRRKIQMVFQDSYGSLDPRQTMYDIVEEPLTLLTDLNAIARRDRIEKIFDDVGLAPGLAARFRHELSGGQQQRVNLARALVPHPALVVLDEPVSSLDASVRTQVISLMRSLRDKFDLSYLFISHDLHTVQDLCDRVAIMCSGWLVEVGLVSDIFAAPVHPYTRQLFASRLALGEKPRRLQLGEVEGSRRSWLSDAKWSWVGGLSPKLVQVSATHFVAANHNGSV